MTNFSDFTKEDRDACLPIVDLMLECTNVARKEGVLALEEFVLKKGHEFLTFAMMLVVDGTDPEFVKDILRTLINSENHTGRALLERTIISEGVLSVQAGENPRITETKLLCFLGERYLRDRGLFPTDLPSHHDEPYNQRLNALINKDASPTFEDFNKAFEILANQDIQNIIKEIDQKDLAIALKGCNETIADKVLGNLAKRLATMIIEDMEYMGPVQVDDILAAQNKILDVMRRLIQAGEIINPPL